MKAKPYLLVVSLFLALGWGCSQSDERVKSGRGEGVSGSEGDRGIDGLDLSRDLEDFAKSFACGDGTPVKRGEAILERIVNLSDATSRTNGLELFRKAVYAVEFSGSDYTRLCNGLGSMRHLQDVYLSAVSRCGGDLESCITFRLDFLKWLKREMLRPLGVDTNEIERQSGPYVTRLFQRKEDYQKALTWTYELHLRWMEEAFNHASTLPALTGRVDSVRHQIETFLGRPVRSDEALLRDSGMK